MNNLRNYLHPSVANVEFFLQGLEGAVLAAMPKPLS
jgi:hypothetical protein